MKIDINSDIGESFGVYTMGNDEALLTSITSANIACGFHAGDPNTMNATVRLAIENGVAIGAHPGFNDKEGFGRRNIVMQMRDIVPMMLYQIGALDAFVKLHGGRLHHVKPHGALYNMAAVNENLAEEIVRAMKAYDPNLILYGLANSKLEQAAIDMKVQFRSEVFADRNVDAKGLLVPRTHELAVIHDVESCAERIIQMITEKRVKSITGEWVPIRAETICVHGDHIESLAFAEKLVSILKSNKIKIISE